MKRGTVIVLVITGLAFLGTVEVTAQNKVLFNTRQDLSNWNIPGWSELDNNYVAPVLAIDESSSSSGNSSVKLIVEFSGEGWRAGVIETEGAFDLTLYKEIRFDVYLPREAPKGISARTIIVTGEEYLWNEMEDSVSVSPGKRTAIKASLKNGNLRWIGPDGSVRMSDELKGTIKKIAIRIESDSAKYSGPVYIDQIKFIK